MTRPDLTYCAGTPIDPEPTYMLEPDQPSEMWAEAAGSELSPEVEDEIEMAREAQSSARMLGGVLVLEMVAIGIYAIWGWWL